MGKSSSSSKKIKRSKDDPSKLRSVMKKKKTKRSKSKKIRRVKNYSDESESNGSDSCLHSSSSEDDYRREKRKSKVSKKKRYSSSESDDDDDDDVREKKRSKRKDEHVGTSKKKKRVVSRKRRKRYSSSSSTSSDDTSESDGRIKTRERLGKFKDLRERSKDESEEESEPDECWQVEDETEKKKKNSTRLKSVVVVTYNYDNDERNEDHDENKIMDDQRDGEAVGYEEYNSSETSKASHQDNSLKDDDLEAILKRRALENLKRFRGETQRNEAARIEGETLHTEPKNFEESQDCPIMEQNLCGSRNKDLASQEDPESGDTAKVKASSVISSCTTKRKLIRPVLGQESVNLASREEEVIGCQDAEAESISGKSVPECSVALTTKNIDENIEPTSSSHAETETLNENKGESPSEQKTNDDETNTDSQYEQKTMTVMRGGEMVQVSYKVYIPKKASSLGRRKLRR